MLYVPMYLCLHAVRPRRWHGQYWDCWASALISKSIWKNNFQLETTLGDITRLVKASYFRHTLYECFSELQYAFFFNRTCLIYVSVQEPYENYRLCNRNIESPRRRYGSTASILIGASYFKGERIIPSISVHAEQHTVAKCLMPNIVSQAYWKLWSQLQIITASDYCTSCLMPFHSWLLI